MYLRRPGRRRNIFLLSTILVSVCYVSPGVAIWPFPPKRFSGNSLVDAGALGLSGDGRVVAFGDFDGDQLLDLLVLGSDQQTLSVHHWNHDAFQFVDGGTFRHPTKVYNVVPGDFTHSGKLDILVMSQSRSNSQLDLTLYPSLPGDGFDIDNPLKLPPSTLSQPIPIDVDGDMKIDLLGMTTSSTGSSSDIFQIWQNTWNASSPNPVLFNVQDANFKGQQCTISNPHSNAVVDLDGDCLADVFIVCDDGRGGKTYQVWVNAKDKGFSLSQQGNLPSGTQAISFADIDRDGTIDMFFSTCQSVSSKGVGDNCYINIAYNQQLPLCTSSTESGIKKGVRVCRRPEDLCIADPNFKYDLTDTTSNPNFVKFPLSSLFPSSPSLFVSDTSFTPSLPVSLKLGDANLDGFPDLLAITVSGNDHIPHLVYSVPCAAGVVGCAKDGTGRRGWEVATKGVASLQNIKDARSLSFVDMDEDGTLDIMVQRSGSDGHGNFLFVQNNFYYDAFFLKAIVLNGACDNGWCYSPNGSERYHPFGVSYSGATYKYTVLDTSGHRSAAQVGQLPQTSYHSLQTPYSFFGLGRTNNYIENLFVGTTVHAAEHYINMEGVIPNSKVVILPSVVEGEAWKRELFLRPGEWIPWVTVTVVVASVLLAIIVFVLHLNEKREDELERRKISHHINFDAL
ncbi:T-cell immunomodulatory protein [Psilocybe cubensis]|uniref:T-cell immunomodulatory protein TIP C2 domain-containing protein n=2 Tax=Psilocybe cubensis TaxID=181762 RepID=A0A8H8CMP7_PSICU|nr:T-cell immunomodulatory protein [Psilocybe cubensis]KAH9483665.1 T-cell immunomodulatory protein [Psilocybe cubensis]